MPQLAAGHVAVDRLTIEFEPSRHPLDQSDETGAVRFSCCPETEMHASSLNRGRHSGGGGLAVVCRFPCPPIVDQVASRRLIIVLMALIAISMAITVISQPLRQRLGPQTDTRSGSQTTTGRVQASDAAVSLEAKARPRRRPRPVVTARLGTGEGRVVVAETGEPVSLLVSVDRATEVSIPQLGLTAFADRYAPARFDLLSRTAGRFSVEAESGRSLGTIWFRNRTGAK